MTMGALGLARWRGLLSGGVLLAVLIVMVVLSATVVDLQHQLSQLRDLQDDAHRRLEESGPGGGGGASHCYTESEAVVVALQGVGKLHEQQLSLAATLEQKADASAVASGFL